MRLKDGFCALALLLAVIISGSPALALDPIPKQPGFSGFIQPGLGYLSIKSNMVAKVLSFDLSDQKINNLNDEPDSQSTMLFSLPFKLAYTFQGGRTQVFLGTEVGDLLSFDTAQQLAIKQEVGSLGVMQAGLLFSGATRVWKDPYVTNQNRDDTDRGNMGAQFTWDKMFGSNLELEYSIRKIDIGSEKSGDSILALTNSLKNFHEMYGLSGRQEVYHGECGESEVGFFRADRVRGDAHRAESGHPRPRAHGQPLLRPGQDSEGGNAARLVCGLGLHGARSSASALE